MSTLVIPMHTCRWRAIFWRYATTEELLDEALKLLKKDGKVAIGAVANGPAQQRRQSSQVSPIPNKLARFFVTDDTSSSRKRALDNLRIIIQLEPFNIKAYEVLATELLYGEINNGSISGHARRQEKQQPTIGSIRHRQGLLQQLDIASSPDLAECKNTILRGLKIDPSNDSLLKLQSELNLVMKYGSSNVQTRMMNVGSFGRTNNN